MLHDDVLLVETSELAVPRHTASLPRRLASEALATSLLVATVVGSGIMAERLAGGNVAIALLANALATGAVLVALVMVFSPISGAQLNPAVTLAAALLGDLPWALTLPYIGAQLTGAFAGVATAHVMFEEPLFALSDHVRAGAAQGFSELVATFGLVTLAFGAARRAPGSVPFVVGAYITAAYWFTASTSFANPAVTVARAFTASFSGIRLSDAPMFIAAQFVGAIAAAQLVRWLVPADPSTP